MHHINLFHLLIEPDEKDAELLKSLLLQLQVPDKNITVLPNIEEAIEMEDLRADVIFWTPQPQFDASKKSCAELQKKFSDPIIIAVITNDDTEQAIKLLRIGVADYLIKGDTDESDIRKSLIISGERKNLQEELKRREARFRGLIENNFDGILLTDENRIITYVSPSVEAITGYSPSELIGFSNTTFIHIEDQTDNREVVDNLLTGSVPDGIFKERYRTKGGELRWIETRVTDCRHIPGLNGYVVNFRDIHEEELANQARIHAEQKTSVLIDSTSDGVWQWNLDTDETFWSDSIYKMLGYGFNDALKSMNIEAIAHPEDRTKVRTTIMKNARNGRPFQMEFRAKNSAGSFIWLHADGSGLNGESGHTELIIGTLRNINKRKTAELALMESRALLKNLTHNLAGSVSRLMVKSESDIEVVFLSKGTEEIYDLTIDEIRENAGIIWDRVVPQDYELLKQVVRDALKDGTEFDLVYRYQSPNGKTKHLHTRGTVHPVDDEVMIDTITMDATPLTEAQMRIAEHRTMLKNILESVSGSIQRYRRNPDGTYEMLYLSEEFSEDPAEKDSDRRRDYWASQGRMDPEHLEVLKTKMEESANTLKPWSHIWKVVDDNGNEKWLSGQGKPEAQEDGSIIWNQVLTDITKLKEIEKELRRVKERFELAAKVAKLGVWEYHVDTDTLIWDDTMYEIFNIEKSHFENSSQSWINLVVPEDRDQALKDVEIAVNSPLGIYQTRFRIRDPETNELKHIRGTGQFTESDKEKGKVMVGFNWDVSAIEETRQKLIESNDRYELASAASSDAIWDWNLKKNELLWSKGFRMVFGHEIANSRSDSGFWESLIHPQDRKTVLDGLKRFFDNSRRNRWESTYRMLRADGTYAEVVDRGFVVRDENGKAVRMVGAIRDFTERARVYRLVEEQNKKLRKIAWSQSHELRSPLSRILGLVDLIENRGVEDLENSEIIGYLRQSALDLDEVIHRIVSLSHDIHLDESGNLEDLPDLDKLKF